MATKIVKAKKVREGDVLPHLGGGYVFEDAERDPSIDFVSGRYGSRLPEGYVLISFHDALGEENYLVVDKNLEVTVERD